MKRVLVLLASAGLLAGCATVPTSGPIRQGNQGGLNGSSQGVVVEAQKPRQNAEPLPIVKVRVTSAAGVLKGSAASLVTRSAGVQPRMSQKADSTCRDNRSGVPETKR